MFCIVLTDAVGLKCCIIWKYLILQLQQ